MADVVQGSEVVLYYYDTDTLESIPFACANQCRFSLQTELLEVTNQSSADYRDFEGDLGSWAIDGSGFTILNDQWNYFQLLTQAKNKTRFVAQFVLDNGTALGLTIVQGTVIITSIEIDGTFNELSSYTFQLQGCGAFSTSGTVVTPGGSIIISGTTLQVFQVVASGGETSITFSGTTGLDAVYASRGGTSIQPLAFVGSPTDPNGGVWDTATGQLNIPTTNPAVSGENFLLLAQ